MCEPVSIIGATAMAAGMAMKMKADADREQARNRTINAERTRQNQLKQQGAAAFDTTLEGFQPEAQAQKKQAIETDRTEQFIDATAGGDTTLPVSGSAPQIVQDDSGRQSAQGLEAARKYAVNLAKMGGFGELFFDNNIALNRGREDLSVLADLSRGSGAVLPAELQTANQTGSGLRTAGTLVGAAGGAAVGAGGAGVGPSFGELFGPNYPAPPAGAYGPY